MKINYVQSSRTTLDFVGCFIQNATINFTMLKLHVQVLKYLTWLFQVPKKDACKNLCWVEW